MAAASPPAPLAPTPTATATVTATVTPTVIAPPVTVTVTVLHDGGSTTVTTTATTVGGALQAGGIAVHSLDKVNPPPTAALTAGATIRVIRVTQTTSKKDLTIAFRSTTKNSTAVEIGSTSVSPGRNGTTEKDYLTTYYDGKAVSTTLAATRVIVAEKDQVTLIGTGQPTFVSHGASTTGAASWYGASGLTAASPTLPFGTVVHVIDTANGRTINVRIEDRGPYGPGRVIDLSPVAFSQLAPLGSGVVSVKLEW